MAQRRPVGRLGAGGGPHGARPRLRAVPHVARRGARAPGRGRGGRPGAAAPHRRRVPRAPRAPARDHAPPLRHHERHARGEHLPADGGRRARPPPPRRGRADPAAPPGLRRPGPALRDRPAPRAGHGRRGAHHAGVVRLPRALHRRRALLAGGHRARPAEPRRLRRVRGDLRAADHGPAAVQRRRGARLGARGHGLRPPERPGLLPPARAALRARHPRGRAHGAAAPAHGGGLGGDPRRPAAHPLALGDRRRRGRPGHAAGPAAVPAAHRRPARRADDLRRVQLRRDRPLERDRDGLPAARDDLELPGGQAGSAGGHLGADPGDHLPQRHVRHRGGQLPDGGPALRAARPREQPRVRPRARHLPDDRRGARPDGPGRLPGLPRHGRADGTAGRARPGAGLAPRAGGGRRAHRPAGHEPGRVPAPHERHHGHGHGARRGARGARARGRGARGPRALPRPAR